MTKFTMSVLGPTPQVRAQNFLRAHLDTIAAERKIDPIRPGYLVCVHTKIKDGAKERVQKFEGRCIGIRGKGLDSTYRVFSVVQEIGICKTFPLYGYDVQLIRKGRSRRAKMNYFKALRGKSAKIRDIR
jgi:large subunit ribosomal protein L19